MTCQVKGCTAAGAWIPVFRFHTASGKMIEGVSCRLEISVRAADSPLCSDHRFTVDGLQKVAWPYPDWLEEMRAAATGMAIRVGREMMVKTDELSLVGIHWDDPYLRNPMDLL